jgi:hypothetical protein
MRGRTTSWLMAAERPYGEFYDFYSVSPEYFGCILISYHFWHSCTYSINIICNGFFSFNYASRKAQEWWKLLSINIVIFTFDGNHGNSRNQSGDILPDFNKPRIFSTIL